jgi:hypothetical protein
MNELRGRLQRRRSLLKSCRGSECLEAFAEMNHHESVSRGKDLTSEGARRFAREVSVLQKRWSVRLFGDSPLLPADHGRGGLWNPGQVTGCLKASVGSTPAFTSTATEGNGRAAITV